MKTLVIIRTCKRDDFLAWYAAKTFKGVMDCDIIFFADRGEKDDVDDYRWIDKDRTHYREFCSNFGGLGYFWPMLRGLKRIDTAGYDKVIFSDADIIVHKSPLENDFEFGGVQQVGNPRHYSGQMLIFSRWIFDELIAYDNWEMVAKIIEDNGWGVADDTMFSFVATELTDKTFDFNGKGYWTHDKRFDLENEYSIR